MNFQEYIDSLLAFAKENPETLTMQVVYSRDSEGNGYELVEYDPSKGIFEEEDFTSSEGYEDYERNDSETNAVCIN